MNYGFVKVAAAVPLVKVADCEYNIRQIEKLIEQAAARQVRVIVFPELSLTGYTCGDLFGQTFLLEKAEQALCRLAEKTAHDPIVCAVGMPVATDRRTYNAAVVFCRGKLLGVVPKTYLPNYNEFYEARWFSSSVAGEEKEIRLCGQTVPFGTDLIFESEDFRLGVEICEDLWAPVPPSTLLALQGANLLVNLSASDEIAGKNDHRRTLVSQQSGRTFSAYVYASAGFGESTTDLVFAGNALIAENGSLVKEGTRFSLEEQLVIADVDLEKMDALRRKTNTFASTAETPPYRRIPVALPPADRKDDFPDCRIRKHPFIPDGLRRDERCEEIIQIQINGLAQRLIHTGAKTAVIGISGGLDSTLALLVCVKTFDKLHLPRHKIIGVTMPGFGTTDRTYQNAIDLMKALSIEIREINIQAASLQHFSDIGLAPDDRSSTYENAQARERTQILMDIANQTGGLVIGTGDLSELALGWATYNGDHMSMYGINAGVPKTLVRYLVEWLAGQSENATVRRCLLDIADTPISPELLPADEKGTIAQKTEDLVGPYELHDFFLYYFIRYGFRPAKIYLLARKAFAGTYTDETLKKWLYQFFRRFFTQQFKRSALPDGPKIGSVSLSPRGDWRMPSDANPALWLKETEEL